MNGDKKQSGLLDRARALRRRSHYRSIQRDLDQMAQYLNNEYWNAIRERELTGPGLGSILAGMAGYELAMSYALGVAASGDEREEVVEDARCARLGGLLLQEVGYVLDEGVSYRGVRAREFELAPITEALRELAMLDFPQGSQRMRWNQQLVTYFGAGLITLKNQVELQLGSSTAGVLSPLIDAHDF